MGNGWDFVRQCLIAVPKEQAESEGSAENALQKALSAFGLELVMCGDTEDSGNAFTAWNGLQTQRNRGTGEWLSEGDETLGDRFWKCSLCGETWSFEAGTPKDNGLLYCPHCGAGMGMEQTKEQKGE